MWAYIKVLKGITRGFNFSRFILEVKTHPNIIYIIYISHAHNGICMTVPYTKVLLFSS